jgi:hypothetical protein
MSAYFCAGGVLAKICHETSLQASNRAAHGNRGVIAAVLSG